jgi:hypothetical protein
LTCAQEIPNGEVGSMKVHDGFVVAELANDESRER